MKKFLKELGNDMLLSIESLSRDGFGCFMLGLLVIASPLWLPLWFIGKTIGAIANKLDN